MVSPTPGHQGNLGYRGGVAVRDMADKALKTFGRIDALYNNAAIRPGSTFPDMTDDDLSHAT